MRIVEIAIGKIGVIGRDERQVMPIGQLDEAWLGPRLFRGPVAHQLDIKPVRKQSRQLCQDGFGGFCLTFRQKAASRTLRPTCQAQKSLTGLRQVRTSDHRLSRHFTCEIGSANELQKVAVARFVLRQQHDPIRFGQASPRSAALACTVALQGDLAADDRLNARRGTGCRDFKGAEQIAGIGDGDRGHAFGLAHRDQLLDRDRPG